MATWQERIEATLPEPVYEGCLRRSLQTVILFEARRCLADKLGTMRPFQRKAAFLDQCHALLESLTLIPPENREEVLWRTASSKEPMDAEIAWKRVKSVEKELDTLAQKIKTFSTPENSHKDAVDALVQNMFETLTGAKGKACPRNWEHTHNNVIFCFRVYYKKDILDPDFPAPVSPREVVIPHERPASDVKKSPPARSSTATILAHPQTLSLARASPPSSATFPMMASPIPAPSVTAAATAAQMATAATQSLVPPADDRMTLLLEVRQHLDLLKEFEGVISTEDLAQRKRELFLALPPAPPDASKRQKTEAV